MEAEHINALAKQLADIDLAKSMPAKWVRVYVDAEWDLPVERPTLERAIRRSFEITA